jgi:Mlc titration factor MtfA (ptsG expression regulator)
MIEVEIKNVIENKYTNAEHLKLKMLEVLFVAEAFLAEHGLQNIQIILSNHMNANGKCYYNNDKISLQINHIINSDIDDIKNTILHEIAHSLVGCHNGHNVIWQEKAKELGVRFTINYRK